MSNHHSLRREPQSPCILLPPAALQAPDKKTVALGEPRLDLACALATRGLRGPTRDAYLNFDKSPQGVEVLVNIEQSLLQTDLDGSAIRARATPLSATAYKRCGVGDVALALARKAFLERGPSLGRMRARCASVKAIVADHSSAESAVVDFPDVLEA